MTRLPLSSVLVITCLVAACQGRQDFVDPTIPGAISDTQVTNRVSPVPSNALIASPVPDETAPAVSPTPAKSAKPGASATPSTRPEEDEGDDEDDKPVGNITVLEAPDGHLGNAAVQLTLQMPIFSELPGTRALGAVKYTLKRDGVLINSTIAKTVVDADRIVDQVASVQVNHCESGAYILQLEAVDESGKTFGTAEKQFKLEAGGARVMGAKLAYVLADGTTTVRVTLEDTPALYVQAGTPSGMTVMWQGNAATAAKVVLNDAAGQYVTNKTATADRRHVLKFTGLKAGTAYNYIAYEEGSEVGRGAFRTNEAPTVTKFKFAAIGDTGQGTAEQFAVARQLTAWKPAFVVHAGDVVYPSGEASAYGPYYVAPYRDLIANTVMYPTLGNHDYRTDKGQPWLDFFEAPRENPDDGERYYTAKYGNVQVFALDTNQAFDKASAQYKWLEEQLTASTATWKIPVFHHPPYSSGEHGSDLAVRAALSPLFEKYKVQLVLTGHDHHYERTKPQNGVTYVVTGGGGAGLRSVKPSAFTAVAQSRLEFTALTVDGEKLVLEAIDDKGVAFDSTTLNAK